MKNQRFTRLAAACLLATPAATASASGNGSEDLFFEPLPVVLTVSRLPQPVRDTPGAISVIDDETIAATGYRDIARLLRLVPGMQVAQERSNEHWVSYHGLGSDYPNQMQVLVDGRSVYSPYFFGGADWGALGVNPEDVERIEIVRGSDSAAYGSNAFLGVVNIITRHTATETGSTVRATLGNSGIADVGVRAVTHLGPLGLRISASHLQDDGSDRLNDGRRIETLNLRGDLRVGNDDELTLKAGISDGRRGTGYEGVLFNGSAPSSAYHQNSHLQARWQHTPSADEEWSLSWYRNRESARNEWIVDSHRNLDALGAIPELRDALLAAPGIAIPVDLNRDSLRDNLEFQHRVRSSARLQTVWGLEWRRDELISRQLFDDDRKHSQQEWRLFGNAEWRMAPRWLWNLGTMVEHIENDKLRLAPRIFLNWQPDPATTARAGYSRAWRQPSLFEREADTRVVDPHYGLIQIRHQGNPDLKPQRIDAFELGLLQQLPQIQGNLDVRVFREHIHDYIVRESLAPMLTPADNVFPDPNLFQRILGGTRWANSEGTVRLNGIEYQLRLKPWKDGQLVFNHTMIQARAQQPEIQATVAPYTASLTWLQEYGPWQSTISLIRMGPTEVGSGYAGSQRFEVDAYNTLDLSVSRRLVIGSQRVEIRLSGINLLGSHQEMVHRPVEQLPQYRGSKAANPVEPQVYFSVISHF
ncbi:TonB-dependent receptor [Azoarcus sp. L1K30]|uniref:TonB-dependent receptor plug domain-containing protein n=1 Tax=Azoarcus sp. L1K30 TaxID=2820277 RepID=UPI001B83FB4A|nr:TonB-dependent receptor [Azoarcus sp. L1K30]MBR0567545.1 TonB-dependent receptor [Azoarcus sp. L1K30]